MLSYKRKLSGARDGFVNCKGFRFVDRNIKSNGGITQKINYSHQNGDVNHDHGGDLGFDFHNMVSMEMLKGDKVYLEARNDEVLKRIAEMQALVMTSEQYLTEQKNDGYQQAIGRPMPMSRLQEEEDSDGSHMSSIDSEIPPPGELKHSDSLLLLTQVCFRKSKMIFNFS